ncbi:MAG: GTPase ObgE [Saprospiraceae bacterium]|nr:GTPase ObgE [Saprospiraceae bacterium]MBK9222446.1 GTPase ObgE [Saprospiraceae bacterium]MBK9720519.1 GTPase ObgE [Saprospiraceae bacterium]
MAEQNFVDYVKIMFRSGKGGAGSVHFFRSKHNPKGGPDGGNGGRGAHVILRGNAQLWTLLHLKYRKHIYATDGENGRENNSTGADGQDMIVEVPLGTIAIDAETGVKELEITQDGEEKVLMSGGRGGMGNTFFKSPTQQTPDFAQPGEPGQEAWKILELKILADVGLVGFPNAGKSTLLSVLTAAKPKIADYAFTTIVPNLGIVSYRGDRSFVMADIPGIIENAHLGKGLGVRFIRHIERNSVLLFMIPCDSQNIRQDYQILLNELEQFNPELLDKPRVLAITKMDIVDPEWKELIHKDLPEGIPYVFISSITQLGLDELKDLLWKNLQTPMNY